MGAKLYYNSHKVIGLDIITAILTKTKYFYYYFKQKISYNKAINVLVCIIFGYLYGTNIYF